MINEDVSIDLPFNVRKNQNVTGKQKMAELAASLVKDGIYFPGCEYYGSFCGESIKGKRTSYRNYQFHGNTSGVS